MLKHQLPASSLTMSSWLCPFYYIALYPLTRLLYAHLSVFPWLLYNCWLYNWYYMFINISQVHIIIINTCILNTYFMVLVMAPVILFTHNRCQWRYTSNEGWRCRGSRFLVSVVDPSIYGTEVYTDSQYRCQLCATCTEVFYDVIPVEVFNVKV